MNWSAWLTIISLCLMGAISPGPSLALVLKHTLHAGRRQGMIAGFTHGLGIGIYALGAMLGIAVIITTSPLIFTLVQWAGAAFLAYLGIKGLLTKPSTNNAPIATPVSSVHAARDGFLMACLNPYTAIFFLALFSQLVDINTPLSIKLLYATTAIVIDMSWYMSVAWFFSQPVWLKRLERYSFWIERIFSLMLIAFAFKLLLG